MTYHVTEPIYVDAEGAVVDATDPSVHMMAVAAHSNISDAHAEALGLTGKGKGGTFDPASTIAGVGPKTIESAEEAAAVQSNHANPVRIGLKPDGSFDDVYAPEPVQLSAAGVPEFVADNGTVKAQNAAPARPRAVRARQHEKAKK